jgi:hypothetical protein
MSCPFCVNYVLSPGPSRAVFGTGYANTYLYHLRLRFGLRRLRRRFSAIKIWNFSGRLSRWPLDFLSMGEAKELQSH